MDFIYINCDLKYKVKNATVRIMTFNNKEINKKYCRDPGLFRAHANSPDLNQGPSDLQSDALPTELSRQRLWKQ